MKQDNKAKKLSTIVWTGVYIALSVSFVASGALVFHSAYYEPIFVDGSSMSPTLKGDSNCADFGIVDNHTKAKKSIKRFDIITTYYPFGDKYNCDYDISGEKYQDGDNLKSSASYKIKRVIALPGETFKIQNSILSIKEDDEWKTVPYTFNISATTTDKDIGEYTLKDNEYWVLGDNRVNSSDCGTSYSYKAYNSCIKVDDRYYNGPIYYENIQGVLIAIEGTCRIVLDKDGNKTVADRKYHWPISMRG